MKIDPSSISLGHLAKLHQGCASRKEVEETPGLLLDQRQGVQPRVDHILQHRLIAGRSQHGLEGVHHNNEVV